MYSKLYNREGRPQFLTHQTWHFPQNWWHMHRLKPPPPKKKKKRKKRKVKLMCEQNGCFRERTDEVIHGKSCAYYTYIKIHTDIKTVPQFWNACTTLDMLLTQQQALIFKGSHFPFWPLAVNTVSNFVDFCLEQLSLFWKWKYRQRAKTNFNLSPIYSSHKWSNHKFPRNHKITPDTNLHVTKHIQTSNTKYSKN